MTRPIRHQRGYTLIETLVAITILMVAIAGPLTVANKALTAALDARNQVIAYNLAQETMEDIKNYKDNNISTWPSTTNAFGTGSSCQNSAAGCDFVETTSGPTASAGHNTPLYINNSSISNLGYSYDPAGTPTPFTRYFYLTQPGTDAAAVYVTVVVSWNTGSVSNQVQLQELMTNAM